MSKTEFNFKFKNGWKGKAHYYLKPDSEGNHKLWMFTQVTSPGGIYLQTGDKKQDHLVSWQFPCVTCNKVEALECGHKFG